MLDRMGWHLALSVEFQARSRLRGIKIWVDLKLGGWTNTENCGAEGPRTLMPRGQNEGRSDRERSQEGMEQPSL